MKKMEEELRNFVCVCFIVAASLTYCYFISAKIPKGRRRLISIVPIILIFSLIPLIHSSFYLQFYFGPCIGWLANFKLLLFAFGKDDSLSIDPSLSLLHFIFVIAFPIKIHASAEEKETKRHLNPKNPKNGFGLNPTFIVNTLIWSFLVQLYVSYREHVLFKNPIVTHVLYSGRMLFGIQVHFTLYAAIATLLLGEQVEPQFNKPYLSTSLQDFWGKRWNLMVASLLKSSIHQPTRNFLTPILGKRLSLHLAILTTYTVSGLMHEVMHFYVGRQWPTWEVTWFFLIHGVGLAIEVEVKKIASRRGWKLHRMISLLLTVGFVMATGIWLCYAELIHWGADVREVEEYIDLVDYVKHTLHS